MPGRKLFRHCSNVSLDALRHFTCEFVSKDQFKSYDELNKRLETVLGKGSPRIDREEYENDMIAEMQSAPPVPAVMKEELNAVSSFSASNSEDTYSYFDSLANDEF